MQLPATLLSLTFDNVAAIDIDVVQTKQWRSLLQLEFLTSSPTITNNIQWPPSLQNMYRIVISGVPCKREPSTFYDVGLNDIPKNLPASVSFLSMAGSKLVDFNHLPPNLTRLNLDSNQLPSITDRDWRAFTFLRLSGNKQLTSLARVQLSTKIEYFDIANCPLLTNMTIDASTFAALDVLPYAGDADSDLLYRGFVVNHDVLTNAANCSALNGTIQRLWKSTTKYMVNVCVLSGAPTTTSPPVATSSSTGLVIGVVVGVLILLGAMAAFVVVKRRRISPPPLAPIYKHSESDGTQSVDATTDGRSVSLKTIGTNGTGEPTSSTTGTRRPIINPDVDVILDVKPLLHHRLELSELIVTSNKPLASGAFGEVWLGTYGGKQVAVKRMKNQDARMAQKFIEEIVLMSQMSSDYIVKFVGASWTRPIEIECVVEFMDLGDLRSYLVSQSPAQFSWDQKLNCITSIVRALVYLHTYNPPIIHRDLKSRNVLLDSVKGTKLTDFGESRVAEEDDLMTNGIGTYLWMAPEVISGTHYGAPADIYSFGIILSEFATHRVPYADLGHPTTGKALPQHYVLQEVREGRLQPTLDGPSVPSWVSDMAKKCLQLVEKARPTSLELASMLDKCRV
ncbi:TKL protein kinase [Saprolegnia diclina VS20]|uniref:TKL protein kinase n=1 Tax=Saprolegnia diclina (strain VS20) TaxID=1156394 RepID=T0Q701_SAPDV|nr:TKL protein kinase [Saprolegnia diclina VS20]EQC29250.1 TKL protein kinase [Saprolegnia diclina VS20]|eukprot:XP_008617428.1 TKL protein kinase [Saprolegnia diclina VS20]